jgi:hypothetical protein
MPQVTSTTSARPAQNVSLVFMRSTYRIVCVRGFGGGKRTAKDSPDPWEDGRDMTEPICKKTPNRVPPCAKRF